MRLEMERRLAEFVDRRVEMEHFCGMLDGNDKHLMLVLGDAGIGKTSLLARMRHEVARRNIREFSLSWKDKARSYDYLAIMRKLRDHVGCEYFNTFTDRVNYFMDPQYTLRLDGVVEGEVSIGERAKFERSRIGDMAGVIIKDSTFVLPRSDLFVSESERVHRLSECFIQELSAATQSSLLFIFFDSVEMMSQETEEWVSDELLHSMFEGKLPNVRCVLCGHYRPTMDRYTSRYMETIVEAAHLDPLRLEDIIEYLAKRGVEESCRGIAARWLLASTGGWPLRVASAVDAALKMQMGVNS